MLIMAELPVSGIRENSTLYLREAVSSNLAGFYWLNIKGLRLRAFVKSQKGRGRLMSEKITQTFWWTILACSLQLGEGPGQALLRYSFSGLSNPTVARPGNQYTATTPCRIIHRPHALSVW
jgi:hypothetical protein